MKFYKLISLLCAAIIVSPSLYAQQTNANIAYVYPAGGQVGTTFKAIIGGRNFNDAESVIVSGDGVSVKIVDVTIPAQQNDVPGLRNKLEKEYIVAHPEMKEEIEKLGKEGQNFLRKKIMENPDNVRALAEVEASYFLRKLSSDAMAETVELEITIDEDAELSERNLMLMTPNGLSNPVKFIVGPLPEVAEENLRNIAKERSAYDKNKGRWLHVYTQILPYVEPKKKTITSVELPVVINGQVTEAMTDTYEFSAKKGQKIVMSVQAQSLIPYISDAVPGWFQPVIMVRNSDGKEMAFNDDYHHHPDSLLLFDVPADGKYTVEINDAIYRTREDFVYRLTVGEIPFVTSIFPLGGKVGSIDNYEINGFNLKGGTVQFNLNSAGVSIRPVELALKNIQHLRLPIMATSAEEILSSAEMERILNGGEDVDLKKLKPVEIKFQQFANGRIRQEGQSDVYQLNLQKCQGAVVEIFARRLNSPMDSYVTITNKEGKILEQSDDVEDLSYGLVTHHADSRLQFVAPETSTYFINVFDASGSYSVEHAYRLYVGEPSGDFELRTVPANINITAGDSSAFTVHAFRKNGFKGPINVGLKNLPSDWRVSGGYIAPDADSIRMTISAPADEDRGIFQLEVFGTAAIGAHKITKTSIPCEDMMQAFYYRHLVPAAQQNVCLRQKPFAKRFDSLKLELGNLESPLSIPIDGKRTYKIGRIAGKALNGVKCNIESSGEDLKVLSIYANNGYIYVVIQADTEKAKVGNTGRAILTLIARKGREYVPVVSTPSLEYRIGNKDSFAKQQAQFEENKAKQEAEAAAKKAAKAAKKEKSAARKSKAARDATKGTNKKNDSDDSEKK